MRAGRKLNASVFLCRIDCPDSSLACLLQQGEILLPVLPIGLSELPAVWEKSGKKLFFQGQGKVKEFHQKSGNSVIIGKVRDFCTAVLVAYDT